MGFWNQAGIFVRVIAIIWVAIIALWLLKVMAIAIARTAERWLLPAERAILQWLQDRAMARALGVDVDIVRVRRKIETASKPIDIPTAGGSRRHC